jgi:hypothetical protein
MTKMENRWRIELPAVSVLWGAGNAINSYVSRVPTAPQAIKDIYRGTRSMWIRWPLCVGGKVGQALTQAGPTWVGYMSLSKVADLTVAAYSKLCLQVPASELHFIERRLPSAPWPANCPDGTGPVPPFPLNDCPNLYAADQARHLAAGLFAAAWFATLVGATVGTGYLMLRNAESVRQWGRVPNSVLRRLADYSPTYAGTALHQFNSIVAEAAEHCTEIAQRRQDPVHAEPEAAA